MGTISKGLVAVPERIPGPFGADSRRSGSRFWDLSQVGIVSYAVAARPIRRARPGPRHPSGHSIVSIGGRGRAGCEGEPFGALEGSHTHSDSGSQEIRRDFENPEANANIRPIRSVPTV